MNRALITSGVGTAAAPAVEGKHPRQAAPAPGRASGSGAAAPPPPPVGMGGSGGTAGSLASGGDFRPL